MKYFGFNPFVKGEEIGKSTIIYDLLNAENYVIDKEIFQALYGKRYKSIDEIKFQLKGKFGNEVVEKILKEGKTAGLIVETGKPYLRDEFRNYFDRTINAGSAIFVIRKMWIQPTGICEEECELCREYINCLCKKNEKEWSKSNIDNLFHDLGSYKERLGEISVIGGDIMNYAYLDYLYQKISGLEINKVITNILFTERKIDPVRKLMNKLKDFDFSRAINLKIHVDSSEKAVKKLMKVTKIHKDALKHNVEVKVELLFSKINENIVDLIERCKEDFVYLDWELLLDFRIKNIEKLKTNNINIMSENVDFNEYYFRKHAHRCWGFAFGINSFGGIKPCLWSKLTFDYWHNGNIKHYLSDFDKTYKFWLDSSLKNHNPCGRCGLRYGCKHCQVFEEYKPGIYKKICEFTGC